ncbi:MAG TPA: hypothetical protein VFZ53_34215 [Polyangiaceae bacterium]
MPVAQLASGAVVWQSFTHWFVTWEQTYPHLQGQSCPSYPLPGGTHVVVRSTPMTMQASPSGQLHVAPSGHGKGSASPQSTAGTHTGTSRLGATPKSVRSKQCVRSGQRSAPQQYGRHCPASPSSTQARPGAQSSEPRQGASAAPVPAGTHCASGRAFFGRT